MNGFQAYKLYTALSNHFFTDRYDFFKYRGKTRLTEKSYVARKDKYYFEKLGKKHPKDLVDFLVANFSHTFKKLWIGELIADDCHEEIYTDWKKRMQALKYLFKEECNKISLQFEDQSTLFDVNKNVPLFQWMKAGTFSKETYLILDHLIEFTKRLDLKMNWNPIWVNHHQLLSRYSPFVIKPIMGEMDEYRKIAADIFQPSKEIV